MQMLLIPLIILGLFLFWGGFLLKSIFISAMIFVGCYAYKRRTTTKWLYIMSCAVGSSIGVFFESFLFGVLTTIGILILFSLLPDRKIR